MCTDSGIRLHPNAREAGVVRGRPLGAALVVLALPVVGLFVLLAAPSTDVHWEHRPSHFWLVLASAALAAGLGWAVGTAARRRADARLFLVSLAFVSAAAFLGLHALDRHPACSCTRATPASCSRYRSAS